MTTRLNKYMAERGVCSRRQADVLISEGKVLVNGVVATLGHPIGEEDEITVNGELISQARPKKVYIVFNKPVGIMTSVDPRAPDTIRTYLNLPNHIFSVGRLDVASSGLLILTNDGDLSEHITHPRYDHEKEYLVTVDRPILREDLREMAEGMMILGSMTKPAKVKKIGDQRFTIILTEGRNRQIRRMCEDLGYGITSLRRIRVMNIELGDLQPGETRPMTSRELFELKRRLRL